MAAMNEDQKNRYSKARTKRNVKLIHAIDALNRAIGSYNDEDAAFDMYLAEDMIRDARDYNVEAQAIRKGGK